MIKEHIDIKKIDGKLFEIKVVEPENYKPASFTHYLHNLKNGVSQNRKQIFTVDFYNNLGMNYLGVTLSGRAFRSNLFARFSQKGFSLQSLTQNTV